MMAAPRLARDKRRLGAESLPGILSMSCGWKVLHHKAMNGPLLSSRVTSFHILSFMRHLMVMLLIYQTHMLYIFFYYHWFWISVHLVFLHFLHQCIIFCFTINIRSGNPIHIFSIWICMDKFNIVFIPGPQGLPLPIFCRSFFSFFCGWQNQFKSNVCLKW